MQKITLLLAFFNCAQYSFCQKIERVIPVPEGENITYLQKYCELKINDSVSILILNDICKNRSSILFLKQPAEISLPFQSQINTPQPGSFIKVTGNIFYNFSYRSYLDTPFAQTDLIQNLIQTRFDFVVKEKYPVRMTISNRNSNSPYFKNITDVNIEYQKGQLLNNIKEDLKQKVNSLNSSGAVANLEKQFNAHKLQAQQLQA